MSLGGFPILSLQPLMGFADEELECSRFETEVDPFPDAEREMEREVPAIARAPQPRQLALEPDSAKWTVGGNDSLNGTASLVTVVTASGGAAFLPFPAEDGTNSVLARTPSLNHLAGWAVRDSNLRPPD